MSFPLAPVAISRLLCNRPEQRFIGDPRSRGKQRDDALSTQEESHEFYYHIVLYALHFMFIMSNAIGTAIFQHKIQDKTRY